MFIALTVYSASAQIGGGQQSVDLRLLIDLARFAKGADTNGAAGHGEATTTV